MQVKLPFLNRCFYNVTFSCDFLQMTDVLSDTSEYRYVSKSSINSGVDSNSRDQRKTDNRSSNNGLMVQVKGEEPVWNGTDC